MSLARRRAGTPAAGLTAYQIRVRVGAEAVRGTLVVRVTATGTSPEEANRLANAYTARSSRCGGT